MFQSLFCWMLFWKHTLLCHIRLLFCVSILILLDVVLEVLVGLFGSLLLQVSILILLDVVLEVLQVIPHQICCALVSILILLDVVLEVSC